MTDIDPIFFKVRGAARTSIIAGSNAPRAVDAHAEAVGNLHPGNCHVEPRAVSALIERAVSLITHDEIRDPATAHQVARKIILDLLDLPQEQRHVPRDERYVNVDSPELPTLTRNQPGSMVYEVRDLGQHRGFIRVDASGVTVLD